MNSQTAYKGGKKMNKDKLIKEFQQFAQETRASSYAVEGLLNRVLGIIQEKDKEVLDKEG